MDYIQYENGAVVGYPRPLPTNFADVSNFYLLDDERLRTYGWYPVRFVPAQKDQNTIVTGQMFVLEGNEVVQYEQVRQKTQDEINKETEQKWETIRAERNNLLLQSDWTQLYDVPLTTEIKQQWMDYRQELRDVTQQTDPDNIVWPVKPTN